jgi:peptidyl-prolyl cis-trans isomerase SurA
MNGILILLALALATSTGKKSNDEVLMTVGQEEVTVSEFETIFQKNNDLGQVEETYLREYTDLFIKFKRKVLDAEEMQLDTSAGFQQELAGYRKQLARPYLTDKQAEEGLIAEAYDRMQYEVRASHILLKLDENALPADTLKTYNRALSLQTKIRNGAYFNTVAQANSEDPSAKTNGGDLGYFSAFRMVYPFESAAFNTKVGDVSMPFRTRFGYHIVNVVDKRKNRGELRVAHIMIEEFSMGGKPPTEEEVKTAEERKNQLLEQMEWGKTFDDLVRHSDDKGSAKKGGELPWFGTGQMVPEFENAAFSLENIGDISEPVKTMYGWHIIKLLETKGVPSLEEAKADIERRIKRDSRSSRGQEALVKKIQKENNFREYANLDMFYTADVETIWSDAGLKTAGRTLFTLAGKNFTQDDFVTYIFANKTPIDQTKMVQAVNTMYKTWVEQICVNLEDAQLEDKHPEFKALMKEYRDGIMLFDLMDAKVWSKAVEDTVGLEQYYNLMKENYRWGERADATVFTCLNKKVAKRVRSLASNRKSVKGLSREELDLLELGKGEFYLTDENILKIVNKGNALNLQLENKKFSQGTNAHVDAVWSAGMTVNELTDNAVTFAEIRVILSPELKTFKEARGKVISDYQNYLEAAWLKDLAERYPATINEEVFQSLLN